MATNYLQMGDVLEHIAAADVLGGGVVVMDKRVGVALDDILTGASGPVSVTGVWTVPKLTTDAPAQGALLYWDATNARATVTATGNTLMGYAAEPAANGDTTVNVKING